jgi:hypothetical protein
MVGAGASDAVGGGGAGGGLGGLAVKRTPRHGSISSSDDEPASDVGSVGSLEAMGRPHSSSLVSVRSLPLSQGRSELDDPEAPAVVGPLPAANGLRDALPAV